MTLREFLYKKTNARELCVIREDGYIVTNFWIDYEDLFAIPQYLLQKAIKKDEWGYIAIVNENNAEIKVPCHYIDV